MTSLLALPWQFEHRLLGTSLSADECFRQLEPHIGWAFAYGRTTRPLRGWSRPSGFTIQKSIRYRNSFQTQATGTFEQTSAGTLIRVRLGLAPIVTAFICCWCAVLGIAALLFLIGGNVPARTMPELLGLARIVGALTGMLLFGIALLVVGRWLARNETDFLMRFLADTLDAYEPPSHEPPSR